MKRTILAAVWMGICAAGLSGAVVQASGAETSELILTAGDYVLTSEECSDLFGGDVSTELQKLIENGQVRVNGTAVNSGEVSINGAVALWENEDGTWSYNAHPWQAHGENLTYEEACYDFTEGISKLAGVTYTVTLEDGLASQIDFLVQDVCVATDVVNQGDYTQVFIYGEGDGSMNRTNPATIEFSNDLVEPDSEGTLPEGSCGIIYWLDEEGWHLKRCDSETVTATADTEFDGVTINQEYSSAWNRPSQPITALGMMELESAQMEEWFINGRTCGWSHTDAKSDLQKALQIAENALETVAVSADGSDLEDGAAWVTQDYYDTFQTLVEEIKAIAETEDLSNSDYEAALWRLSIAYGGSGSDHDKEGNVYPDGIGFKTFACGQETLS